MSDTDSSNIEVPTKQKKSLKTVWKSKKNHSESTLKKRKYISSDEESSRSSNTATSNTLNATVTVEQSHRNKSSCLKGKNNFYKYQSNINNLMSL